MESRKGLRRASIPAFAVLLLAGAAPAWSGGPGKGAPNLVPLPHPPDGPAIRRVLHDAREPVAPGAKVTARVLTEEGAKVAARLGTGGTEVPCQGVAGSPGTYTCGLTVPAGASGVLSVIAEAADRQGHVSTLTSLLPVVIASPDPWRQANTINIRLQPVYFGNGDSALDDAAGAALEADAALLRRDDAKGLPVVIEGHCDKGEPGDLDALSHSRAAAVADRLVSLGLARDRVTLSALAAAEPISTGAGGDADGLNRRVMILVQPPAPAPH